MAEIDWARYAGQLGELTREDRLLLIELEKALIEEQMRAEVREARKPPVADRNRCGE